MRWNARERMTDVELSPVDAGDHVRGPADAPLTLIEYADFECPYCREAYPIVQHVERRFAGKLRFVFRQFPLTGIHEHAQAAAEACEAAGAQDRFWQMHDQLFTHADLDAGHLRGYAQAAGVADIERFDREVAAETYAATIAAAVQRAQASGVEGTPMFFINGSPFEDEPTVEALSAALEAAAG